MRDGWHAEHVADRTVAGIGTWRFLGAQAALIVLWAVAGSVLGFDSYPFLALTLGLSVQAAFTGPLILVAAKKDDRALHAKLDELIRATQGARDRLAGIEEATSDEIESVRDAGAALHAGTRARTLPADHRDQAEAAHPQESPMTDQDAAQQSEVADPAPETAPSAPAEPTAPATPSEPSAPAEEPSSPAEAPAAPDAGTAAESTGTETAPDAAQ